MTDPSTPDLEAADKFAQGHIHITRGGGVVNLARAYLALRLAPSSPGVPEGREDDRVRAWYAVHDTLQQVAPGLIASFSNCTGAEAACKAIRTLAVAHPIQPASPASPGATPVGERELAVQQIREAIRYQRSMGNGWMDNVSIDVLERALASSPAPGVRVTGGECSCEQWGPGIAKLNGPIVLAQARNPALTSTPEFTFTPFKFCPWCGAAAPRAGGRDGN